jgi:integrase
MSAASMALRLLSLDDKPDVSPPAVVQADRLPRETSHFFNGAATVREVLDWYAANNPNPSNCKKANLERARLYGLFAGALGDMSCSECRPHDLLAFINQRSLECSDWTKKRWNATLQRPFNFAVRLGLIARNPFKGVSFPEGQNGRDWTAGEYRALLQNAKPHLRRLIIFIRFSGCRPGEARNLAWRNVKIDSNAIILEEHKTVAKTRRPRRIPLNHVLVKLLLWVRRNIPTNAKRLFLNAFGKPWTMCALTHAIADIREKGGLSDEVRLHGGRHTFRDKRHPCRCRCYHAGRDPGARRHCHDSTLYTFGREVGSSERSDGTGHRIQAQEETERVNHVVDPSLLSQDGSGGSFLRRASRRRRVRGIISGFFSEFLFAGAQSGSLRVDVCRVPPGARQLHPPPLLSQDGGGGVFMRRSGVGSSSQSADPPPTCSQRPRKAPSFLE